MKKIQVSTVRQTADIEVLFVNANLISKAINAKNAIQDIIEHAKAEGCIVPRFQPEVDENNDVVRDEYGQEKFEPVLDDKGNQIIDYTRFDLQSYELSKMNTVVITFLDELVKAFEE